MEMPAPVVKGVHYTCRAMHCVVGVGRERLPHDLLGQAHRQGQKGVKEAVEDSEVGVGEVPITSLYGETPNCIIIVRCAHNITHSYVGSGNDIFLCSIVVCERL